MRVLLVKTSSLGDVIHNLPVVSDITSAFPNALIDWVVEESFEAIPAMHPALRQVIPVAVRRWRKALWSAGTWRELGAFRRRIRQQAYDAVLDTQGLLKSALLAVQAQGPVHGLAADSAREPAAARLYGYCYRVPRELHAVTRNRQLAALALGYRIPDAPDYGLPAPAPAGRSAVLLTATSRPAKQWEDDRWVSVGRWLAGRGLTCRLPAGSPEERRHAVSIAAQIPGAEVVPPSSLTALAAVIGTAQVVIGVDTGLIHLAAALSRPCIGLYRASSPLLTGVLGRQDAVNLGGQGRPPTAAEVIAAAEAWL